jgi:hypothetical protein
MPANPLTDPNWASDTTDRLVTFIDTVRSQTTNKVVYAARGVVFGLIALIVGTFALILAFIIIIRALETLLDVFTTWERAVYLSYFILGGALCIVGMVLFKKRNAATG